MPTELIELSRAQVLVVTMPDGKIEFTVGASEGRTRRKIIRFELLPMQAQSLARDIVRAVARKS